jgi:hypothetical protein
MLQLLKLSTATRTPAALNRKGGQEGRRARGIQEEEEGNAVPALLES